MELGRRGTAVSEKGFNSAGPRAQLAFLFELLSVALVALIPWGSGADRLRMPAGAVIAAIMGAVTFPLVAHWAWGGGWLAQLGANFSAGGRFLRRRRGRGDSCARRCFRIGCRVDRGAAQGEVSARGTVDGDAGTQRGLRPSGVPDCAGGMAGMEYSRLAAVAERNAERSW